MTTKVKKILFISFVVAFLISIGFNIFILIRYNKIKHKIEDVVDTKIDAISENVEDNNDEINETHENIIFDLQKTFSNQNLINFSQFKPLYDQNGLPYVTNIIGDNEFTTYLSDDIKESQGQIVFYSDKLNYVTEQYELEAKARNIMINNLKTELETTKQELKNDISDQEMSQLINNLKPKFMRFGLDLWVMDNLPVTTWLNEGKVNNFGYFSGGVGLNWLFMDKLNVRLSIGGQQQLDNTINPTIGASIGFYF